MSLIRRLLGSLRSTRSSKLTFQVDARLIPSLEELAARRQRSTGEVASDLLAQALDQRRATEEILRLWERLSPRQREVAALTCLGYTNVQIAKRLVISPETVKTHIRNVLYKFNMRSKAELRQALSDWDFSAWDFYLF